MKITRRQAIAAATAWTAVRAAEPAWSPEWDRAIIDSALRAQDRAYDPAERMLARDLGGAYNYHSALRNSKAHPTRDSLAYALNLLEAGGAEQRARASAIIDRVIAIQETDPSSRFYGIWGYYLEEPAPRMQPADFNWADFNGSLLLLIELRHGSKLDPALRGRVLESIRHAANSVRRRNVTMSYTNIAVQGTFVTLAAAERLGDRDLWAYATDRQRRFAAEVDKTGSFAEYNSPTYANVAIVNFTRIAAYVKDSSVLELNARLHEMIWRHLGVHWHVPTRQLAGPMSRCYSTDIGSPLWIQKALGGRLKFAELDDVRARRVSAEGEVAFTNYRCPDSVAPMFLDDRPPREHRERFTASVTGTTWLDRAYSLGSVNRGNFWVQQRAVLAYWGGPARPAHYGQLRFMHDDYDFASALLYSTQRQNRVLGLVNFRNPGGDKHVSIDMIRDGRVTARSLRLRLDIADPAAEVTIQSSTATVRAPNLVLRFAVPGGEFAGHKPEMRIAKEDGQTAVIVDLLASAAPREVKWADVGQAWLLFALSVNDSEDAKVTWRSKDGLVRAEWNDLRLAGSAVVDSQQRQDAAFEAAV